ncbi:MAG: DUF1640 domain-containing protein [Gammaproteobacteria bacterium]|nr:DUF1640 domain-containing protein [Gammaproteobacteria bacterium]
MEPSVIDTLRYADRLKAAGMETRQAEAMSRALNDELAGGVATKQDLDRAVDELRGEIAKVDAKFDVLDAKVDALSGSFETQGKYVFLVLALIAALGLYNAVAPHLAAVEPQTDGDSAETAHA